MSFAIFFVLNMSLLKREKGSRLLDDPFFDEWTSGFADFRKDFFKTSLFAEEEEIPQQTSASGALRRQRSWYDRELEAASKGDSDFSLSKSFHKVGVDTEVAGCLVAEKQSKESEDGRQKEAREVTAKEMASSSISADGSTKSAASEKSLEGHVEKSSVYVSPDGGTSVASASAASSSSSSKSEVVSSKSDGISAKSGALSSKSEAMTSKSEALSSKSEAMSSKSMSSQSEALSSKSAAMSSHSEASSSKSQAISSKSAGMSSQSEAVSLKSEAMASKSEAISKKSEAMASKSEAISNKSEALSSSKMASSSSNSASALSSMSASVSSSSSSSKVAVENKSSLQQKLAVEDEGARAAKKEEVIPHITSPPCETPEPPSYAESVVDEEEEGSVYFPINYREIGRQNSIPISQSFFTVVDGNKRTLKLQFYIGRGWETKSIRVSAQNRKLIVQCRQDVFNANGEVVDERKFDKEVDLPEEVDEKLVSSLLSIDGILTVHCQLPDRETPTTTTTTTISSPVVIDEDGNKVIHLQYDVGAFAPEEVKVTLRGNTLQIRATKEEHSAEICVRRELKRDFALPADADKDSLVYKVEGGILSIKIRINQNVFQRRLSEEGCVGNKIQLEFDVGQFNPEDIQVFLVGNTLKIVGRRQEEEEKAAKVVDYSRECVIPSWVDSDGLRSYLTREGKLTVEVPMEKTVRSELHVKVNQ